jgi:hypothetical protein
MFFGLISPMFLLYFVYALWCPCSQILAIFWLRFLVYLLPDFSYILFMFFGLLAPRFWLFSVYALWFTCSHILAYSVYALWCPCSQILAIFWLRFLVYLLPDFSYILFMFFGLLAPRFWLFYVYALWLSKIWQLVNQSV